jgi:hypothetical protein
MDPLIYHLNPMVQPTEQASQHNLDARTRKWVWGGKRSRNLFIFHAPYID